MNITCMCRELCNVQSFSPSKNAILPPSGRFLSNFSQTFGVVFQTGPRVKGGSMHFFKNALENWVGPAPKQTWSQSAVRGVSTHDARRERSSVHMTDISRAEPSDNRKIEMADKINKRGKRLRNKIRLTPCVHRTRQSDHWKSFEICVNTS